MKGLNQPTVAPTTTPKPAGLSRLRSGVIERPFRVLLYGPEKTGKSTFAAQAPKPIFLCADAGTEHLSVDRFPAPETWSEALGYVRELQSPGHGFRTLVIDPVNFLEPLVHTSITGSADVPIDAIKSRDANGYVAAKNQFEILKKALELVWLSGVNILIVGHSESKRHDPPDGEPYDRFTLAMNEKCAGILKRWVDHILFVRQDAFGEYDKKTKKSKAKGTGAVYLYTRWAPAYDAGNRARLPASMPLSWREFYAALTDGSVEHARIVAEIEADLARIADPKIESKVREYLADPTIDVAEVANKLRARIGAPANEETEEGEGES